MSACHRLLFLLSLNMLVAGCQEDQQTTEAADAALDAAVVEAGPDITVGADQGDSGTDATADAAPSPVCEGSEPVEALTVKGRICLTSAELIFANIFVSNQSSVLAGEQPLADSDQDGIADSVERDQGTDPLAADSDQDGYGDLVERALGRDPSDSSDGACPAGQQADSDGDGLRDCEELALGTDPENPDSDGDFFPDNIELRFGTDPLALDMYEDSDFDGHLNSEEVRSHTDPLDSASTPAWDVGYRTNVVQVNAPPPDCFDFNVRNIATSLTDSGWNTVLIYLAQATASDSAPVPPYSFRVACVRVCAGDASQLAVEVPQTAWKDLATLQVPGDCLIP